MTNKTKLLNFEYSSLQGTYWMYYGAIYSFASAFLLSRNITNSQIGLILAVGNILGVLSITFFSNLADKTGLKGSLNIGILIALATAMLTALLLISTLPIIFIAVIFIAVIAIQTALQPLISALSFKLSSASAHVSFGFARSMGSLSYSILCVLLGRLVDRTGTISIPICGMSIAVLMMFSFLSISKTSSVLKLLDSSVQEKSAEGATNLLIFIKTNKAFFIMCIGIVALFFSNGILNSFLLQIVKNIGGTNKDLGYIFAFMAFLEVPTLLFFDQINRIFKYESMLKLSAICFTLKIALCTVAKGLPLLYLAHFLQPVAFALFLPAMVHYIDKIMKKSDAVKGQGLFTLAVTVSSVLASMLGGFLIDNFGILTMNICATVSSFIGAVVIILIVSLNKSVGKSNS